MRISDWSSDVCSSDLATFCALRVELCSAPRTFRAGSDARLAALACEPVGLCHRKILAGPPRSGDRNGGRSEEHTSELQSLMRRSYAVFSLKQKNNNLTRRHHNKYHIMMCRAHSC